MARTGTRRTKQPAPTVGINWKDPSPVKMLNLREMGAASRFGYWRMRQFIRDGNGPPIMRAGNAGYHSSELNFVTWLQQVQQVQPARTKKTKTAQQQT